MILPERRDERGAPRQRAARRPPRADVTFFHAAPDRARDGPPRRAGSNVALGWSPTAVLLGDARAGARSGTPRRVVVATARNDARTCAPPGDPTERARRGRQQWGCGRTRAARMPSPVERATRRRPDYSRPLTTRGRARSRTERWTRTPTRTPPTPPRGRDGRGGMPPRWSRGRRAHGERRRRRHRRRSVAARRRRPSPRSRWRPSPAAPPPRAPRRFLSLQRAGSIERERARSDFSSVEIAFHTPRGSRPTITDYHATTSARSVSEVRRLPGSRRRPRRSSTARTSPGRTARRARVVARGRGRERRVRRRWVACVTNRRRLRVFSRTARGASASPSAVRPYCGPARFHGRVDAARRASAAASSSRGSVRENRRTAARGARRGGRLVAPGATLSWLGRCDGTGARVRRERRDGLRAHERFRRGLTPPSR